jgi:hypothetical protein
MRWVGHTACMGEMKNSYNILIGIPERKRLRRRAKHGWKHIKMDLK